LQKVTGMANKPTYEELEARVRALEHSARGSEKKDDVPYDGTEYMHSVFRALPTGIGVTSDRIIKQVNERVCEMTGFSQEELVGQSARHLYPSEEEYVFVGQHKYKQIRKHGTGTVETRWKKKDGEIIDVLLSSTPMDLNDLLKGVTFTAIDITERKEAEKALRDSEDRTRATFNAMSDAVFLHPLLEEGFAPFVDVNDTACNRYGYTREEILTLTAGDITGKAGTATHSGKDHRRRLENSGRLIFEATHITKSGEVFPVEINSVIIELKDRPMILAVVRDISERKRAEEALRATHQRFLTVLDSIDATIYVADLKTYEVLFMNQNMIKNFGRDMTGEICWEVFRGESGPCSQCTNDQLIDENGEPTGVCVWQCDNPIVGKSYINYDRAIEWTDGRMVRLQIATDITEMKNMERQLQQTQKFEAIGTLAGGIAHDFNNLLMGIQGRASLMSVDIDPSHAFGEHVDAIEEYIRSATDLTKQLLGFARGGKYEVKPIDINKLVSSSAAMFGRTKKEIRIHYNMHDPSLVVSVDRRQIEQVLLNLYVNAWQAMPGGGEIYLETKIVDMDDTYSRPYKVKPGPYTKVSVTDTGMGMDPSIRQRIFDPFFTTKEKGRGTGLGLASAYGIIKNHGGVITVYSEVGTGTAFNIYLPLSEKSVCQEKIPKELIVNGTETILLVDDEEIILDVAQAMLKKLGYRVLTADGGRKAVDLVKQNGHEIDMVIVDLIMPEMEGGKVFDLIRETQPAMPVILSSGYSINGQANEIMQRGCSGFIQKPFTIFEISKKIRSVLDGTDG